MILIGTSVWIDYFNGRANKHTDKLDDLLSMELVIMGDIILADTLQGFRSNKDFKKAKELLGNLKCYVITNKTLAIQSAKNFRQMRKNGIAIRKTIDVLIGTFYIENDIQLLHIDRDFKPLEKLGLKSVFQ
ncbi:MAG: PIN domain nuclease [Chlorobi bacterium]|nr:PIN domain nuclease [Chlorobiota bacterium]